jgi:hypothetical protein
MSSSIIKSYLFPTLQYSPIIGLHQPSSICELPRPVAHQQHIQHFVQAFEHQSAIGRSMLPKLAHNCRRETLTAFRKHYPNYPTIAFGVRVDAVLDRQGHIQTWANSLNVHADDALGHGKKLPVLILDVLCGLIFVFKCF